MSFGIQQKQYLMGEGINVVLIWRQVYLNTCTLIIHDNV